ncbi:MAG: PspC domain-containing protein [Patescibacteria group bacterium]|nr:PspC domain-containing protein [Patescibacteria group bacterium]
MTKIYNKKLYRSSENKVLSGVLGGVGEYFAIDPVVFRVIYLCFTVFTGFMPGVFAYILMAIIIPRKPIVFHEKAEVKD